MSNNELAQKVVSNELRSQDEDHDHWMYRPIFFKTITVQETEHRSDFYRVPDDLTPAEAAQV